MKKILFINQETIPYVPENIVSTLGKLVPKAIQEKGCEIRTFMPKWGDINERRGQLHEVIRLSGLNISIDDTDHQLIIKVASIPQTKIQVYFIDNDDFFMKRGMKDKEGNDFNDNGQRAIFFVRGVIETVKKLRWAPDIIHCQGWMSAFAPLYIKKAYADEPTVANAKIVSSFFGEQSIPVINDPRMKDCIAYRDITTDMLANYNDQFKGLDLARIAIENSDGIISACPTQTPEIDKLIVESGVKYLPYPGEDFAESYLNFYDSLYEAEKKNTLT